MKLETVLIVFESSARIGGLNLDHLCVMEIKSHAFVNKSLHSRLSKHSKQNTYIYLPEMGVKGLHVWQHSPRAG